MREWVGTLRFARVRARATCPARITAARTTARSHATGPSGPGCRVCGTRLAEVSTSLHSTRLTLFRVLNRATPRLTPM